MRLGVLPVDFGGRSFSLGRFVCLFSFCLSCLCMSFCLPRRPTAPTAPIALARLALLKPTGQQAHLWAGRLRLRGAVWRWRIPIESMSDAATLNPQSLSTHSHPHPQTTHHPTPTMAGTKVRPSACLPACTHAIDRSTPVYMFPLPVSTDPSIPLTPPSHPWRPDVSIPHTHIQPHTHTHRRAGRARRGRPPAATR